MSTHQPSDRSLEAGATSRRVALERLGTLMGLAAAAGHATLLSACGGGGGGSGSSGTAAAKATVLNDRLESPWGLVFLPDERMLVTQKSGSMLILSADGETIETPVTGLPPVRYAEQGGLLDVALDPEFTTTPWVYWSYSEPGIGAEAALAGTAVARGRLEGAELLDVEVIFRQQPKVAGSNHYGARIVFRADQTLFITLGDRRRDDPAAPGTAYAQNVANHLGKVVRIRRDGSVPDDNPDFGPGSRPELWSIGHRNPQGAALDPDTGDLWLIEHGPQGGDELNHVRPGDNYGWPLRSYGCPYPEPVGNTCRVGGGTHAPDFVEPVSYWVPTSIAPSGLMFVTSDRFPEWQGSVLIGALAGTALWRVALDGDDEVEREELFAGLGERMRCVRQGPDGWVYLLTDSGKLIRVGR